MTIELLALCYQQAFLQQNRIVSKLEILNFETALIKNTLFQTFT